MNPYFARILTCPKCGKHKEVLSLMSGNTFNAVYWSDGKMVAPMLPQVSGIQKCPFCGTYFFLDRQKEEYSKDSYSFELGTLSFEDCKEAHRQFKEETLSDSERMLLLYLTITAYNDKYYRSGNGMVEKIPDSVNADDLDFFKSTISMFLKGLPETSLPLRAELLREAGKFNKSIMIFENYNATEKEPFFKDLKGKALELAINNESRAFILKRSV